MRFSQHTMLDKRKKCNFDAPIMFCQMNSSSTGMCCYKEAHTSDKPPASIGKLKQDDSPSLSNKHVTRKAHYIVTRHQVTSQHTAPITHLQAAHGCYNEHTLTQDYMLIMH